MSCSHSSILQRIWSLPGGWVQHITTIDACLTCSDTNLLVWGVDLVEEHLMTSAGIPARPPVARKPLVQVRTSCQEL